VCEFVLTTTSYNGTLDMAHVIKRVTEKTDYVRKTQTENRSRTRNKTQRNKKQKQNKKKRIT